MKKLISIVLTVIIIFTGGLSALAAGTGDVYSDWSRYYIRDAGQMYDILPPSLEGGDYTQAITRGQFCELAWETMAYMTGYFGFYEALRQANENGESFDGGFAPQKVYPVIEQGSPFTDTDDERIVWLYGAGIVEGKGGGRFDPDGLLTRAEAAAILGRIVDYYGLRHIDACPVFTDAGSIPDWALDGVDTVCGIGIMNGMGGGIFSPLTPYTREQAVATMIRKIDAVPYLLNREEIAPGQYFVFNFFWMWVEDEDGTVLFKLPCYWATYDYRTDYGYSGIDFFEHDGKLLAAALGSSGDPVSLSYGKNGTTFFELYSGAELLFIPLSGGVFFALTKDRDAVIMEDYRYSAPTVDAAYNVYAVYDFSGKELVPPGSDWQTLYDAGYVDTERSVDYVW